MWVPAGGGNASKFRDSRRTDDSNEPQTNAEVQLKSLLATVFITLHLKNKNQVPKRTNIKDGGGGGNVSMFHRLTPF